MTQDSRRPAPEVPEELKGGVYANELYVSGSQDELVLDFVRVLPGDRDKGEPSSVVARIIIPPSTFTRMQQLFRRMRVELEIANVDRGEDEEDDDLDTIEAEAR